MFRCDQCKREFGGIRGIAADRCPRCATADNVIPLRPASPYRPAPYAVGSTIALRPR
jgi:hypothetical protein